MAAPLICIKGLSTIHFSLPASADEGWNRWERV